MTTGLLLEGGAMRGLYTAGVLDIFCLLYTSVPYPPKLSLLTASASPISPNRNNTEVPP